MPYIETWNDNVLHRQYRGVVTGSEIIEANLLMYGHKQFDDLRYLISDFSSIDTLSFDIDDFQREIAVHAHLNKAAAMTNSKVKIALVATDENVLAFTNLYKAVATRGAWPVEIFADLEAALAWAKE